ncbi:MAG TPA: DUF6364 family protein [Parasegetibacter sp.]
MTTKLTLTMDDSVIDGAKKFAAASGRSLSSIVESYLRTLAGNVGKQVKVQSPKVARLMGSVRLPEDFDYKIEMASKLTKKHS